MSCSRIVDPTDPNFEIVTLRVPVGTVDCAETLASNLVQERTLRQRHKLLFELRDAPLEVLQTAKDSLGN